MTPNMFVPIMNLKKNKMDKTLQDLAWSVLPKEFKEEVKKYYQTLQDQYKDFDRLHLENAKAKVQERIVILKYFFGYHNLTSDAEGEEMLTVPRSKVIEIYNPEHDGETLYELFGSKCLPDTSSVASNVASSSQNPPENCNSGPHISTDCDKPAEPKFTKGDMVHCKSFGYEGDYKVLEYSGGPRNCYDCIDKYGAYYRFYESDLEPYTEPTENLKPSNSGELESQQTCTQFDNIVRDGFSKERRLNIATQITASIYSNDKAASRFNSIEALVRKALDIADTLIAECEKGGQE